MLGRDKKKKRRKYKRKKGERRRGGGRDRKREARGSEDGVADRFKQGTVQTGGSNRVHR